MKAEGKFTDRLARPSNQVHRDPLSSIRFRSLKINKGLYNLGQLSNVDNLCDRQSPSFQ